MMKNLIAIGVLSLIAASALAASPRQHPLFGKWKWTLKKNNCTEIYYYRPNHTAKIKSGEEIAESKFTITDKPDKNGFYLITDEATKDNGRTGCDGRPNGTPVGDKVTDYIFINRSGDEMYICDRASFESCFMGPLRRVPK